MENMEFYNLVRTTPAEAKKSITGGRLRGMTDINPQYRIQTLTERFGPVGKGWYYTSDKKWTLEAGDEIMALTDISLYVKYDGIGGEWSAPIHGTGGSKLLAKESGGLYASDEAFKMANTDALSVACKQIGIAADVYWEKGESKYPTNPVTPAQGAIPQAPVQTRLSPEILARRKTLLVQTVQKAGGTSKDALTEAESDIVLETGFRLPLSSMTEEQFAAYLKAVAVVIKRRVTNNE